MVCPLYNIIEPDTKWNLYFGMQKQYTGLEHCQARDEEKLNYHFNASLTSVNIAKRYSKGKVLRKMKINISISDIKIELSNRLLLDLFISNYGIDQTCKK